MTLPHALHPDTAAKIFNLFLPAHYFANSVQDIASAKCSLIFRLAFLRLNQVPPQLAANLSRVGRWLMRFDPILLPLAYLLFGWLRHFPLPKTKRKNSGPDLSLMHDFAKEILDQVMRLVFVRIKRCRPMY